MCQSTTVDWVFFPRLYMDFGTKATNLMQQLLLPTRPSDQRRSRELFIALQINVFFYHQLFLIEDITQHRKKSPNCHLSVLHIPLFNMAFCSIYIDENLKQTKGTLVKTPLPPPALLEQFKITFSIFQDFSCFFHLTFKN